MVAFNYVFNAGAARGGGVYGGTVYNSTIVSNGSVWLCGGADGATLFNSLISYSRAASGGYAAGFSLTMYNCIIANNFGPSENLGAPKLANCLVYGNVGTAVYGSSRITNCTIVGNSGYGLDAQVNYTSIVVNCIIYSNKAANVAQWSTAAGGDNIFSNSCTWPASAGWSAGNTTNDPLFMANGSGYGVNLVPGNYRLQSGSPCVNSGLNQAWMTNAIDLDGKTRIRYGTVDMGTYETLYHGTIYGAR